MELAMRRNNKYKSMRILTTSTIIAAMSLLSVCPISALAITPPSAEVTVTNPAPKTQLVVDGTNGLDSNDGSESKPLKTIQKALEKATQKPANINIKGNFSLNAPIEIPQGITLSIDKSGATITGSNNANDGITLKSGSTLRGDGELKMTAFRVALTAEEGSLITDGTYNFKDNGVEDSHGIYLAGTIKGTSKDKLTITADDNYDTNFYADGITFENATINVKSQIRTWFDARDLTLKNSSLTVAGFGMSYYVNKLNMDNSEFVINKIGWRHPTGLTIQGDSTVTNNSRIVANAGSTAGISVGISNGKLTVTNSTLEFNNGGAGGLNVNTGKVIISDSTIKGNGKNSGALFGAQENGSIELREDCLIDSPAIKNADGGAGTGNSYVVTGGSHMVTYAPDYHNNRGSTVPVNGKENGNERLSLFTLADSSVNEIKPINKNGNAYIYSVKKASKDNKKHVWVPAAKVTFELNDTNAEDSKKAKEAIFSDFSTKAKESLAVRGYALNFAKTVAGGSTEVPANPIAPGYKFLGWFCKNAQNSEQKFTEKMIIKSDTTVYAKWEKDPSSYAVRYHNCAQDDATYLVSETSPKRTSKVLSFDEVIKNNAKFARKGMVFKGWTTEENGKGKTVKAGSNISISQSENLIDLYANWEEKEFTVKFSANGGTFSNNSIFKTNTKVFEIKDEDGGDVAVVKKTAKFSENRTLINLIKSLDKSVSIDTPGISGKASSDSDANYTNLATRKYYHLINEKKENSFFGYVYSTDYCYWFKDKDGTEKADINNKSQVNDDLTFYLKWELDSNVEQIQPETLDLPADLLTGDNTATTAYKVTPGQTIDFTGTITASVVKDQMKAIENTFKTVKEENYSNIALSDMTSSFTATFTIPDGLTLPKNITKNTLKLDGFSDTFAIQNVKVKGKTVTVTINLKSGITTYAALKTAVQTNLGDTMKITIPGIKINQDFSGKATIVGTVSGSFHAAATFNETTKLFDFTWNGSQTSEGKNSDAAAGANGISLTVEYDPPTPPTPPTPEPTPDPEPTPEPEPTPWPKPAPLPKENPNNKIVEKHKNENNQLPKTGSEILLTAFSAIAAFGLAVVIAKLKRIK